MHDSATNLWQSPTFSCVNAHVHDSDHLMMCLALRAENEFTAGESEAPSPISIISYFNKLLSGISCFAATSSVKLDCFRQSLRRADNRVFRLVLFWWRNGSVKNCWRSNSKHQNVVLISARKWSPWFARRMMECRPSAILVVVRRSATFVVYS